MIQTDHFNPAAWLERIRARTTYSTVGRTPWFSGAEKPAHRGWYERVFTDGLFRHWWNGKHWSSLKGGQPHWRQVGDYPCWRGLKFMAWCRGKVT